MTLDQKTVRECRSIVNTTIIMANEPIRKLQRENVFMMGLLSMVLTELKHRLTLRTLRVQFT